MTPEAGGSTPSARDVEAKLYAVGRADLAPGLRAAQLGHALIAYVLALGPPPDNLVLLDAPDEPALHSLLDAARERGIDAVPFFEPDLDGALTAVAFAPNARRLLSSLPLAMRSLG